MTADAARTLNEPRRRAVYDFVRSSRWPVTREDAAEALDISRSLAAFHLERLVDAGLVEVVAARPDANRGGRPPKLYRVSPDVEVWSSIPPRRYDLAAQILVRAIAAADDKGAVQAVATELAGEVGEQIVGAPPSKRATITTVTDELAALGYEPVVGDDGEVVLANCPFHMVAMAERDVTCALNHAFLEGVLRGCRAERFTADLAPGEGRCCVVVSRADT